MPEKVKIKDLIPDDANFNAGNEFGESLIEKSFSKFGAGRSILLDKNNRIIAGNKSTQKFVEQGGQDVVVVETTGDTLVAVKRTDIDLNTKRGRELALADNASAKANITWDETNLKAWDMPVEDWGVILAEEIEPVGDADAEPETDKAQELNEKWQVQSGDLWAIGNHRLLCGSSTAVDDVERVLGGNRIDAVFTSPPYNSGDVAMRGGGKFSFAKKGAKTLYSEVSDNKTPEEYFTFCIDILTNISLFVNDLHSVFWNVSYNANSRDDYGKIVFSELNPFRVKETIIWDKGHGLPITSEGILSRASELIFLMSKGGKYLTNQKIGAESVYWNTWRINTGGSQESEMHKACFPLGLPTKAIADFTPVGANVFEPFTGSGTTFVACQNLGRRGFGIELSPTYCAVILERMHTAFPDLEIKRIEQAEAASGS